MREAFARSLVFFFARGWKNAAHRTTRGETVFFGRTAIAVFHRALRKKRDPPVFIATRIGRLADARTIGFRAAGCRKRLAREPGRTHFAKLRWRARTVVG